MFYAGINVAEKSFKHDLIKTVTEKETLPTMIQNIGSPCLLVHTWNMKSNTLHCDTLFVKTIIVTK